MASGEKAAKRAFSDVLAAVPDIRDAVLDRPCSKMRQARAAVTRQAENERKAVEVAARETLSATECLLARPIARTGGELWLDRNQIRRHLGTLRHMPGEAAETMIANLKRREALNAAAQKTLTEK